MKKKRLLIIVALVLCAALVLALVLGPRNEKQESRAADNYYEEAGMPSQALMDSAINLSSAQQKTLEPSAMDGVQNYAPEKLITTITLNLKSEKFDEDLQSLLEKLDNKGYVETSKIENQSYSDLRRASLTIRVAKDKLDSFMQEIEGIALQVYIAKTSEDVTQSYRDNSLRLETQKSLLKRLNELAEKADKVEDMIEIETKIAEVQYSIDSLTSSLMRMDNKVDFATVYINMDEIRTQEKQTYAPNFFEKIGLSIQEGFENIGIFLEEILLAFMSILPLIIIVVLVIFIGVLIYKKIKKNRRNQK